MTLQEQDEVARRILAGMGYFVSNVIGMVTCIPTFWKMIEINMEELPHHSEYITPFTRKDDAIADAVIRCYVVIMKKVKGVEREVAMDLLEMNIV